MTEARPYTKEAQLERPRKRYRRVVASRKQWEAIIAEKSGPCRVDDALGNYPLDCYGHIEHHHIVARSDAGDDVAANIAPLCEKHHGLITGRELAACRVFVGSLSDAEYAYMVQRGGEDYPERAYGITFERGGAT